MEIRKDILRKGLLTPPDKMACVAFLYSAAVTAAIMAMPFLVFNQLGQGATVSGIIAGMQALGYTVVALASSRYVARARNGLVWGSIGIAGFMAFIGVVPFSINPFFCGAMFTIASALSALAWPSFHSYVGAEHDPNKRARYMGRINVGWSVGGAAGPFLAGPLYEMDYHLPFFFVVFLSLWALLLIRSIPHENDYFAKGTTEALLSRAEHDRASEAFLWCAWLATLTAHICIGAARSIFPKRLDDIVAAGNLRLLYERSASPWLNEAAATRFSWLIVALGLATGITFFILGRSGWWHHRFLVLVVMQLLTGVSLWTLGYTHSLLVMLAAFAIIGANLGIAFFSSAYYGMANPARKHGRSAINEGVVGVGGMLGSFGFALAGARFGLEVPFHWMPGIIIMVIMAQFILIKVRSGTLSPNPNPLEQG